jgi:hypothetical protein
LLDDPKPDPDPCNVLLDPDPGLPKTYGSYGSGSGSATLDLRCVQVEIVDIITLERRTRVREGGGGAVGAAGRLGFVVAGDRTPRATAGEAASPAEVGFSTID